jgi:hypothetical protein
MLKVLLNVITARTKVFVNNSLRFVSIFGTNFAQKLVTLAWANCGNLIKKSEGNLRKFTRKF